MKKLFVVLLCGTMIITLLPALAFAESVDVNVETINLSCIHISEGDTPGEITYSTYPENALTGTVFWEKNDGSGWRAMEEFETFVKSDMYRINASQLVANDGYILTSDTEYKLDNFSRSNEKNSIILIERYSITAENGTVFNAKGEEINSAWATEEVTIKPNIIPEGKVFYDWNFENINGRFHINHEVNLDTGIVVFKMPEANTVAEAIFKYPIERLDVKLDNPLPGNMPSDIEITFRGSDAVYSGRQIWYSGDTVSTLLPDNSVVETGFLEGQYYRLYLYQDIFGDYLVTRNTQIYFNGNESNSPDKISYTWGPLNSETTYPEIIENVYIHYEERPKTGRTLGTLSFTTLPAEAAEGDVFWEKYDGREWIAANSTDVFEDNVAYRVNASTLRAKDGYAINNLTLYFFDPTETGTDEEHFSNLIEIKQHVITLENGTVYNSDGEIISYAWPGERIFLKPDSAPDGQVFRTCSFDGRTVPTQYVENKEMYSFYMLNFDTSLLVNYGYFISRIDVICDEPEVGKYPSEITFVSNPEESVEGDKRWLKSTDGMHFDEIGINESFKEGYYYAITVDEYSYLKENHFYTDKTEIYFNGKKASADYPYRYVWGPLAKKENPVVLGGGYYISTVEKPVINVTEGVKVDLSSNGETVTISIESGYQIVDVTVNGISKGAVTTLSDLKSNDVVNVVTEKLPTEEELLIEAIAAVELDADSEFVTMKNGKKAIKITWSGDESIELDGIEVFRSTKRYSGYGNKPFFVSKSGKYYNTAIKKGTTYYYRVRGYVELDGEKYYSEYSTKAWRTVK